MKTLRNTSIILAVVALALLVAAPVAMAGTITYTSNTIPSTTTPTSSNMGMLALEQFNNTSGPYAGDTLNSIIITLYGGGTVYFSYDLISTGGTGGATLTINSLSDALTLTASGATVPVNLTVTGTYTPSSTISDSTVGTNYTTPTVTIPGGSALTSPALTDSTDLTDFTGLGNVDLTLSGADFTTYSGNLTGTGYEAAVGSTSTGGGYATVTYNYSGPPGNTPEPGTLSLFGTGLLGLAGMLRYKFGKAR
jgi:hypothetical protein